MKLKTLLLGSAAAFAVVGGAQAADLSVAEPVDYVRVCDAFGAGYWYIPGTDTCLKIGGYVQFDVAFHTTSAVDYAASGVYNSAWAASAIGVHSAGWEFRTEAEVNVTAKSMTEYGPLTGYVAIRAKSNNADASNNVMVGTNTGSSLSDTRFAYLDSAWLELGMLLVGRTGSIYDYSGGFTYDWKDLDSDDGADQVRLSWAMSGFGVQLAIEDPRDKWGTSLSTSYSMPNIVGALTMAQGHWDGKLSVAYAETSFGSGFGIQAAATIKLDSIAPGDKLLLKAAWAQREVWKYASSGTLTGATGGSAWSAAASFQHFWSPTLSSAATFQYASQTGLNSYQISGNLVWAPVTGFAAGAELGYQKTSTATTGVWGAKIRLKRSW